jgi:hypothetical protein
LPQPWVAPKAIPFLNKYKKECLQGNALGVTVDIYATASGEASQCDAVTNGQTHGQTGGGANSNNKRNAGDGSFLNYFVSYAP